MSLFTHDNVLVLWQDVVKQAENHCLIELDPNLETYLISLLMRYTTKPEMTQQIFATAFLEALQLQENQRKICLQKIGDECLLFAGLFPHAIEKRHVNIAYFVDIGRSAYLTVSNTAHDLYWSLALRFVVLMDVLQSIRQHTDLLPLEAYEQWNEVGSQRAFRILQSYSRGVPFSKR
ncbi:MAG: hypothetical protein JO149_06495 [Gammaproteobacteria bacterium]|nr:hypothetical protein [Gammaproteobacteria bacterium]